MSWRRGTPRSTSSCSTPAATTRSMRPAPRASRASTATRGCSCPTRPRRGRWRSTAAGATAPTPSISRRRSTPAGSAWKNTFKRTLKGVYQETDGQQTPWISSTFFGDFVFHPKPGAVAALAAPRSRHRATCSPSRFYNSAQGHAGGNRRLSARSAPIRMAAIYRGIAAITPNGESDTGEMVDREGACSTAPATMPGACWW